MPKQPTLAPLTHAHSVDEVINSIDTIISWSIANSSRVGYFAALYKRITLAVRKAIADNEFQDCARMAEFDFRFANRYFDALNGHFHPQLGPPTKTWQLSLRQASDGKPIIVQHLLGACNAHIAVDLGITAHEIAAGNLAGLHEDFNKINDVLASETSTVIDSIDTVSPVLADVHAVLKQQEIDLIDGSLKILRDRAWQFAADLSDASDDADIVREHDLEMAMVGEMIYHPGIPMAAIFDAVAKGEQRDIAENIRVLDEIASAPHRPVGCPWRCGFLRSACRELRGLASAALEPALAVIGIGSTSGRTSHR
ncbi:MAG: DUF5995 family protein [Mycobacterium sp.]|uniref:DUF5995 family protein n=1 Tax=Mycobacterium sp. TaxID=1785 RepID=UPI00262BDB07|nr:DUF5995 family protein [Mycobacterium sp.]MDI3314656.1 DUF5995 family protein [Mycobacterium sp.]